MKKTIIFFFLILTIINCNESINESEDYEPIDVDVRMEVQILDSVYQLYSRPHTKIYFTSYKLSSDNNKIGFSQTDTTSCPNGWGVKLLKYTINNSNEYIVLGAANDNFNGKNYREIRIDYDEAVRRIDTLNHSSIIKTLAIYYK